MRFHIATLIGLLAAQAVASPLPGDALQVRGEQETNGRSGYNSVVDTQDTNGRSGYNSVDARDTNGRSGYNSVVDAQGTNGRGGYN